MPQYNLTPNTPGALINGTKEVLRNADTNDSNLLSILKTNYNLNDSDLTNIEGTLTSSKNYTNSALNNLSNITTASQVNLDAASNNLVNQMVVNDVINTEIHNTQAEYNSLLQNNTNQRRLVENNTYYTQRYEAHTELMKTIIIICIPLLLITLLGNKGLLPGNLAYWLGGIGLLVGLGIVGVKVFDLYYRDNFNFNEYTQPFYSAESQKEVDAGKNYGVVNELAQDFTQLEQNLESNLNTCFGSACCGQGLQYVASKRLCELKPVTTSQSV
jgi:hypothetical protein